MQNDRRLSAPSPHRVLVVDDDLTFVTFVCEFLERMDLRPEVCFNGADALMRVSQGHWAGVLLEMRLPDVDGLQLLSGLRQGGNGVPVVVITGAGNVPAAVKAMRLGAVDFVEKPISVVGLRGAVEQLLAAESWVPHPSPADPDLPQVCQFDRSRRLTDVVVGFVSSASDVRTTEALCRAAGVYVAPRTFRAWCRAEKLRAGDLLDLARVLRAHWWSTTRGCRLVDSINADERTTRSLLRRGFSAPEHVESFGSLVDVCRSQTYVTNPRIVEAIIERLRHRTKCRQA